MSDYLFPVGGADEVGASAIFLEVDGIRMLFDCGARQKGEERMPHYHALLKQIEDFGRIDYLFISHAHYDHIGSFSQIASLSKEAEIFATKATKELMAVQLLQFGRMFNKDTPLRIYQQQYVETEDLLRKIQEVSFLKVIERPGVRITFLPAGHMVGAAMIQVETKNRRVLYTGDFSLNTMNEVNNFRMPNKEPDLVLMNAIHAYHPFKKVQNSGKDLMRVIDRKLRDGKNIYIHSGSIAKHLDLFYVMKNYPDIDIYLSKQSEKIGEALSALGYAVFQKNMKSEPPKGNAQHILIGTDVERHGYEMVNFDLYSLHAGYQDLLKVLKQWPGAKVYLLHARKEEDAPENIIQRAREDRLVRTIRQAENEHYYNLGGKL